MNILAVFAHPDDEVLGCGGTLAKHAENGDTVQVVVCCKAAEGLADAAKTLGVKFWSNVGLPDQALDSLVGGFSGLVEAIKYRIVESDVDIVYTHHPGDLNLDHALTARAVLTAFRPKPGEKPRTILACEVLSSTEWTFPQWFQPNWFEEITYNHQHKVKKALECYTSEIKAPPHPRSKQGLVVRHRYRGHQCGVEYAEAFQLLRRGPM